MQIVLHLLFPFLYSRAHEFPGRGLESQSDSADNCFFISGQCSDDAIYLAMRPFLETIHAGLNVCSGSFSTAVCV